MDIGKSFSYVFEDPRWVSKVAIGGAILLVGLVFFWVLLLPLLAAYILVFGYALTVIRNVAEGSASPLPEWSDFGGYFMKGLYAAIGAIVIYIPAIVLICCTVLLTSVIGGAAASSSEGGTSSGTSSALGLVVVCVQCLYILYAIVAAIYLYAPLTRYAINGQLSTFWDFRGNLAFMQSNIGGYVIALIMTLIASVIGSLGLIVCGVGYPFTLFWSLLVTAHIFGQFAAGVPPMSPLPPPPMAPPAPAA